MKIKTVLINTLAAIGLAFVAMFAAMAAITVLENSGICTGIFSVCITSEKAIQAAEGDVNFQAFVETYPNSTLEYRGNYHGGSVVVHGNENRAELEVILFVSGNIEGTGAVLYCLNNNGARSGINYTSWGSEPLNSNCSIYDPEKLPNIIRNRTCG